MTTWLHANGDRGTYPATWYADGAATLPRFPPLKGRREADLCVIGGGLTGLSAALDAARAGMRVVLLEAQRVGWGASGRNGGQVGSGFNWSPDRLARRLGEGAARALWDLAAEAREDTLALAAAHGADPRRGILYAALSDREAGAHEAAAETLRGFGADVAVLDRAAAAARLGTEAYAGGLLDREGGWIDPLAHALGLARACLAAGVAIHEGAEVHAIRDRAAATGQGAVTAPAIVVATNGYGAHLTRAGAARVLPINNYIAVTAPLDPAPMPDPVAVADSRTVVNYLHQTRDGRLVYGGGESYGRRFPADIRGLVRANLARVYPDLRDVELTHAWGGTLAVTASRLPWVAEPAPGLFAAGGYSGHGLALAGTCGRALAEAARGDRTRLSLLERLPVPALPGGRWLGGWATTLGMWAGAMGDRLKGG